ncbi:MAG: YbaB/EbfC family nucleoid-associated protein [Patescibacteria group bacterium]|jgi:DNA-binding protein YbaB
MFNKIKHLKDLRNQAKTLENALEQKTITVERGGISLTMDGNQAIREIKINPELTPGQIENIIPPLFKEANDRVRRLMAETMQSMGGLNFPGM